MTMGNYELQAKLFAALSHPVRLRILDMLADSEACVCHFSALLQLRQAYVSQQLATLKQAGLITDKKDGLYVYYCLTDATIGELLREAREILAHLTGDDSLLHAGPPARAGSDCPCPRCQAVSKQQAVGSQPSSKTPHARRNATALNAAQTD